MANKFARTNGNFNGSIWALTSGGVAGSTPSPTVGDNAVSNNFTVQITSNVACDNITNSNLYGGTAGGTFNVVGSTVTANILAGSTTTSCVLVSGTNSGYFIGDITGGTGSTSYGLSLTNTTGTVSITGNINAAAGRGINATSNSKVTIRGNVVSTNTAEGIARTSTTVPLSVYGNIINAPNGRQAIYAPRYQVFPTGSAQYTRQAVNGYDSYVDYWTSDSTFSYPTSSDVVANTTYSNGTLSGSMALPSPSSVALGAPVGTTTGIASITFDNVLSQPIANLNTPNSIGARLKNITTSQALSAIVDSLEF